MPFDQYGNYTPYPQPNYPQRQPGNTYAFVNGLEGAKSYQVPVNQSLLLMDSDQPVCYMKTANALGQATLRCFKLVEVKEEELKAPTPQPTPNVDYATKEDLKSILDRLEKLETKPKE